MNEKQAKMNKHYLCCFADWRTGVQVSDTYEAGLCRMPETKK